MAKYTKIVDTTLRDAHQSLIATRMTTNEIVSVIQDLDKVGFYALEVWGGATFDVSYKFLNENPWDRLKIIKKNVRNTKLQMLLRGQNLVGYRPYANDTVKHFIYKAVEHGIDIIRVFDALNDFNNLVSSINFIKSSGAHCQVALAYTISPYHNNEYFIDFAIKAKKYGADSICIKDMSGILSPTNASILVEGIKKATNLLVNIHGHDTSGIISATYLKAIDAGVDIIDTAMSPFSSGNSQPPTESFINILYSDRASEYFNLTALESARIKLKSIREKYIVEKTLTFDSLTPYPNILFTQVPGGMLSNLYEQLKIQKQEAKFQEVLDEVPKVRADLGYPPLVTPISQFVGVQATLNVLLGERYKIVPSEIKDYLKGKYGRIIGPISANLLLKLEINAEYKVPDYNYPEFKKVRDSFKTHLYSDENILSSIIIGKTYSLVADIVESNIESTKQYKNDIRFIETEEILLLAPLDGKINKIFLINNEKFKENNILISILTIENINIELLAPCDGQIIDVLTFVDIKVIKNQPIIRIKKNEL